MVISEIPYGSPLYEGMKALRQEMLRTPLGLLLDSRDTEGEAEQIHIAAMEDDRRVIGTVILKLLSKNTVKLRQMAVSADRQGKNIGKNLILFAEKAARTRNFTCIEMHARVYAQVFYEKLGYKTIGDTFTEVTVPTIKMIKDLS